MKIAFGCTAFLRVIESTIRLILTAPIRNTAIKMSRSEYLLSTLEQHFLYNNTTDFGSVYSRLRRIETIFTAVERDFSSCVTYFPLWLAYIIKIFICIKIKFIVMILVFVNLISLFYAKRWAKTRGAAFKADEQLNDQVFKLFRNTEKVSLDNIKQETNKILDVEAKLYIRALLNRQWYKLAVCLPNVLFAFFLVRLELCSKIDITKFILFTLYWAQFSSSFISVIGMMTGLKLDFLKNTAVAKSNRISQDITIEHLHIPNVFRDVSVFIKFGTKIALTGHNGSGKTLLCRIISGLEPTFSNFISGPGRADCILITNSSCIFDTEKQILKENKTWNYLFAAKYNHLLESKFLSRGQESFLAVCALMIYDKQIILIDEALDVTSGDMLNDLIKLLDLTKGTIIVISHREDIINAFDRKIVIANQNIEYL